MTTSLIELPAILAASMVVLLPSRLSPTTHASDHRYKSRMLVDRAACKRLGLGRSSARAQMLVLGDVRQLIVGMDVAGAISARRPARKVYR